jgi:hypothetical protein
MIKEKKCKGINKAISFQGCGKLVNVAFRKYGLCSSCYAEFLTETEVGKVILFKTINKVQKPRIELEKAHKEHKEKKGIAGALLITKTVVHAYVRKRDEGKPCIACGCQWSNDFHASHYYPSGSFETLKFHLDNIHSGCQKCNLFLEGNFESYTLNLPKRIGKERFDNLVGLAEVDKQFSKVWNLDNLKEIRENIKKLNK